MSKKPLIGLNTDFVAETHDRPAYSLAAAGYFDQITAAGGIPLMVPPMEDPDDIDTELESTRGLGRRPDVNVEIEEVHGSKDIMMSEQWATNVPYC